MILYKFFHTHIIEMTVVMIVLYDVALLESRRHSPYSLVIPQSLDTTQSLATTQSWSTKCWWLYDYLLWSGIHFGHWPTFWLPGNRTWCHFKTLKLDNPHRHRSYHCHHRHHHYWLNSNLEIPISWSRDAAAATFPAWERWDWDCINLSSSARQGFSWYMSKYLCNAID